MLQDSEIPQQVDGRFYLGRIIEARRKAWMDLGLLPPGSLADGSYSDPADANAEHWVIWQDGLKGGVRVSAHQSTEALPDADQREAATGSQAVPDGLIGAMNRLFVDPDCRGRGYARRLDLAAIGAARAMGCGCLIAVVHGDRVAALTRGLGYRPLCRVKSRFLRIDGGVTTIDAVAVIYDLTNHHPR